MANTAEIVVEEWESPKLPSGEEAKNIDGLVVTEKESAYPTPVSMSEQGNDEGEQGSAAAAEPGDDAESLAEGGDGDDQEKPQLPPDLIDEDDAEDKDSVASWIRDYPDSYIRDASELGSTMLYQAYVKKLEREEEGRKKKKKIPKGPKLVKNFVDYVRDLEQRVEALETKTAKASALAREEHAETKTDGGLDGEGADDDDKSSVRSDDAIPQEAKSGESQEHSYDMPFFPVFDEIETSGTFKGERLYTKNTFRSSTDKRHLFRVLYSGLEGTAKNNIAPQEAAKSPEKIIVHGVRVHSAPITAWFGDMLDYKVHKDGMVELLRPFRILIRNVGAIKNQLQHLETTFGDSPEGEEPPPTPGVRRKSTYQPEESDKAKTDEDEVDKPKEDKAGEKEEEAKPKLEEGAKEEPEKRVDDDSKEGDPAKSGEESDEEIPAYDTREALTHFRKLVSFIDTHLAKDLKTYADLRSGKTQRVAFENLWMLFDAGDTIYSSSRKGGQFVSNDYEDEGVWTQKRATPQAYRVLGVAGGIMTGGGLAPRTTGATTVQIPILQRLSASLLTQGFKQREVRAEARMKDKYTPLLVSVFYIDFDTNKYITVADTFTFKPYEGVVDITSLEAYPIKNRVPFSQDGVVGSPDELIQRGRKYVDMTIVSHMNYEGLTVGDDKEEINSPVIVDYKLASQNNSALIPSAVDPSRFWFKRDQDQVLELAAVTCSLSHCYRWGCATDAYPDIQRKQAEKIANEVKQVLEELDQQTADDMPRSPNELQKVLNRVKQELEDTDLIVLLPGVVHGYALRNRKWVDLDLFALEPVKQEDGWKQLVLPKGHKRMVQAMVEMHAGATGGRPMPSHTKQKYDDVVRGKGKGCIILLHGAPGVGKTSTAECVAAYTNRPLFPITCGDIGYQHDQVEQNLESLFSLAFKWGCVLLLDEADVFLAKRTKDDIKRNGLVSIFLRILEYYPGILFLTTNRVGAIDDAFRSRLHLTLFYPKLSSKKSLKVWKMNMDRMRELNKERAKNGRSEIVIRDKKILDYAKLNYDALRWNGRQIRNAFQTALALAEFKAKDKAGSSPVLGVEQFETIASASELFDVYLKETHGMDEEKTAQRDRVRVDKDFAFKAKLRTLAESDEESSSSEEESEVEKDKKKAKKTKSKAKPAAPAEESEEEEEEEEEEDDDDDEEEEDDDDDDEDSEDEEAAAKKKKKTPTKSSKKEEKTKSSSKDKKKEEKSEKPKEKKKSRDKN